MALSVVLIFTGALIARAAPEAIASSTMKPTIRPLPTGVKADYQLGGPSKPAKGVGIVARDRLAHPARGVYNICYINAYQTQPGAKKLWERHGKLVLRKGGKRVKDADWNEYLLDIRTAKKRKALLRIVGPWIDRCARDGFDAVEFDNLDSFTRSRGLLTTQQAKKYARLLVRRAHRAGLAAGQKNWSTLDGTRLGFDFAVAESCARYRECGTYAKHYGGRVIDIEYRRVDFRRACADQRVRISIVLRDLALKPHGRRSWC
ncbi:endo alpha-1,4 polygalactosaminidase [Rarobacter faecitabidus]